MTECERLPSVHLQYEETTMYFSIFADYNYD